MSMSHLHTIFSTNLTSLPSEITKLHHHRHHHDHFALSFLHLDFTKTTRSSVPVLLHASPLGNLSASVDKSDEQLLISGSDVVRKFYAGINRHDLAAVQNLIALDCVYEDLIFPRPFVGRKAILEFFGKFIDSISMDLQFVIDAISEEDSAAVGVTWHLEWKGKAFPFSKGCSFYQLALVDGSRQIIYARDSVEPAIKPGESALVAIRGVTWLLQQFPNLIDKL